MAVSKEVQQGIKKQRVKQAAAMVGVVSPAVSPSDSKQRAFITAADLDTIVERVAATIKTEQAIPLRLFANAAGFDLESLKERFQSHEFSRGDEAKQTSGVVSKSVSRYTDDKADGDSVKAAKPTPVESSLNMLNVNLTCLGDEVSRLLDHLRPYLPHAMFQAVESVGDAGVEPEPYSTSSSYDVSPTQVRINQALNHVHYLTLRLEELRRSVIL